MRRSTALAFTAPLTFPNNERSIVQYQTLHRLASDSASSESEHYVPKRTSIHHEHVVRQQGGFGDGLTERNPAGRLAVGRRRGAYGGRDHIQSRIHVWQRRVCLGRYAARCSGSAV